jgi:YfiH family protein
LEKLLTFDIFNSFNNLTHFCTTRIGGVSQGSFASLNLSPFSGDSSENFQRNLQIVSEETGINTQNFIIPFQTHEDKVLVIDEEYFKLSNEFKNKKFYGVDAIVTKETNICIGVTTADCVPILLYDTSKKVIAVVHAGWRGTCARLVEKTINQMQRTFGSVPAKIYALLGPSISSEAYEVGNELIEYFSIAGFNNSKIFEEKNGKQFLNLWEANRQLLIKSGVPGSQIQISGICTYTQHEDFFSARRLGIHSGRMLSGIMLK